MSSNPDRLAELLDSSSTLSEATMTLAQQHPRTPGTSPLGPQQSTILSVLDRLHRAGPEGGRRAARVGAETWGLSDREPDFSWFCHVLTSTDQPPEWALDIIEEAALQAVPEDGRLYLVAGLTAIAGAHLLTPSPWRHWTRPVAAAIGEVLFPRSDLTSAVPGCTHPVGSHLLPAQTMGDFNCTCPGPLPGLSLDGTRIARELAANSDNWSCVLATARLLDPDAP